MKAIIIVVIILNLVFCFACAKVSAESDKAIKPVSYTHLTLPTT